MNIFSNNFLRFFAGFVLLILSIAMMYLHSDTEVVKYIVVALASFLVGGNINFGAGSNKDNGNSDITGS